MQQTTSIKKWPKLEYTNRCEDATSWSRRGHGGGGERQMYFLYSYISVWYNHNLSSYNLDTYFRQIHSMMCLGYYSKLELILNHKIKPKPIVWMIEIRYDIECTRFIVIKGNIYRAHLSDKKGNLHADIVGGFVKVISKR